MYDSGRAGIVVWQRATRGPGVTFFKLPLPTTPTYPKSHSPFLTTSRPRLASETTTAYSSSTLSPPLAS